MKYHNKVIFKVNHEEKGLYTVGLCEFTIDNFSITDGQDPEKRIQVEQRRAWSGPDEGSFNFEVGRKNKDKAANFWKENFTEKQSTFDHYPDKLNFAFYGPLEIQVRRSK